MPWYGIDWAMVYVEPINTQLYPRGLCQSMDLVEYATCIQIPESLVGTQENLAVVWIMFGS